MSEYTENVQERHGLFRNVPRFLRRAIERRLANLEADPLAFERETLVNQERLKRLYALLHVKAGERGRILFGKPPADSARAALRELATMKNPHAAAVLVRRHRLPYLLVEAALGSIPEPVALALVETLDAKELLARLALLARRGLIQGDVKAALLRRLQQFAEDSESLLSYQAAESIARRANLDQDVVAALFDLVVAGPLREGLSGDTAILADASSSMERQGGCLELAAQIAWRIDQILENRANLFVYLFGCEAWPADSGRHRGAREWRTLFTVKAPQLPGTSAGAGVERLIADVRAVDRIVVVSDGMENRPPRLAQSLERYVTATSRRPAVHVVQPAGSGRQLATDLRNAQMAFTVFSMDQHLLGLDAFTSSLLAGTGRDAVAEILE
jgi:hypothetical protein